MRQLLLQYTVVGGMPEVCSGLKMRELYLDVIISVPQNCLLTEMLKTMCLKYI